MSKQADAVVKYAKKWADEKYKEGPNNDTVFGKWFGLNNQPWCMMFVMWCLSAAKAKELVFRTASCEALESWAVKNKKTVSPILAQAGDILLFDFHKIGRAHV